MTEIIIASTIGLFQVILSIYLIIRQKNRVANVSEILSSLMLLFYLNGCPIGMNNTITWKYVNFLILEYLCVKIFLIIFMLIARYISFYVIKIMCRKKTRKLILFRNLYKANYWPRLKLGLPDRANKKHPITKVQYDSKGFPKFKVYYTVKLKKKYHKESRERHFYMANRILDEDIRYDRNLKLMFSKSQLKEICSIQTPTGYTWHHNQNVGVLQLVDEEIHAKTYHIGGYTIWGGNN